MAKNKEIEYTSPFNVNNQIYFCGVPFRLDTYSGCSHRCSYCFVRAAEITSASRDNKGQYIIAANPKDIRRDLITALDTSEFRESIVIEWLRHKMPIHWGGMSDPFQPIERKFKASLEVLKILNWYNYPTVISSKGTIALEPEYLELIKTGNFAYQTSLITHDEDFIHAIEPGTPSAKERLKVLETLANHGVWTAVRIQPVIPNTVVESKATEFIKILANIGVKHILPEGYKVPVRAEKEMKYIWELCPNTAKEYQSNDTVSEGFEQILPSRRKWQYMKPMLEAAHENRMTYGSADNDLRDLGDTICCCGIDKVKGFENFWRYQASQAADIAKKKGYVTMEDMQQFWHGEKSFSIHNDVLRHQRKRETGMAKVTPKYAIDEMWKIGGPMSPECMISMKKNQRNGELVYERNNPIPLLEANKVEQKTLF